MLKQLNKLGAHVSAFIVAFGAAMSFGADAFANDIDAVVQKTGGQLNNVGDLVNIAAYGGGAVLTGTGLLNFKKHVDNPSQNELRKAIGPGVVGIGLLAFPTVAGILDKSMLVNGTNRGYDSNAFQATF